MSKNTLSTNKNSRYSYWNIDKYNRQQEVRRQERLDAKREREKLRKRNIKIAIGVIAVSAASILFSVFGRSENGVANAKTVTKQEQEFKGNLGSDIAALKEVSLPAQPEVSKSVEADQDDPALDQTEEEAAQIQPADFVLRPEDADSYYEESLSAEGDTSESIEKPEKSETDGPINLELPETTKTFCEKQKQFIEKIGLIREYEQAVALVKDHYKVDLPWQIAAALHYVESNNNPKSSMWAGEELGTKNFDDGQIKPTDLALNCASALEHFIDMAKEVYDIDINRNSSIEDWAKAMLAFNRGHRYARADMLYTESVYVMKGLRGYEKANWSNKGGKLADGNSYGEPSSVRGESFDRPAGALAMMISLQDKTFIFDLH